MPHPIRKRFGYGLLWPLQPVCSQNQPGSYNLCQIRLPASVSVPFFPRRHGSYCAKPTRIRSGWPGQGLAKRIWSGSKPVCRNHLARFLAGRNRPATSFPATFKLGSVLPQTSRIILYKPSPDPIEFLLIVSGFDQTDPVRKQAGVQESSGPLLANASQPIRTGCESDLAHLRGLPRTGKH